MSAEPVVTDEPQSVQQLKAELCKTKGQCEGDLEWCVRNLVKALDEQSTTWRSSIQGDDPISKAWVDILWVLDLGP